MDDVLSLSWLTVLVQQASVHCDSKRSHCLDTFAEVAAKPRKGIEAVKMSEKSEESEKRVHVTHLVREQWAVPPRVGRVNRSKEMSEAGEITKCPIPPYRSMRTRARINEEKEHGISRQRDQTDQNK